MTISSEVRKAGPYTGNGTTTQFAFTFRVFEQDDVKVILTDAAGVETVLVLNSDYYVTLNDEQETNNGGYITYPRPDADPLPANLPSTKKITILGAIEYTQEVDITNGGGFYPEVIESALDKMTMQIQQIKEVTDRSITVNVSGTITPDQYLENVQASQAAAAASASAASGSAASAATSAAIVSSNETAIDNLDANMADINTVATNILDVSAVAAIDDSVSAVALIDSEVVIVAGIDTEVVAVAGNSADIDTVSANITYIQTIGSDLGGGGFNYDLGSIADPVTGPSAAPDGYIITVYNSLLDITTVAGLDTEIAALGPISANITTVAGIAANVTAVAGDATDIGIVATNIANVNTVAANVTDIDTVVANLTDIQNAEENAAAAAASALAASGSASAASSSAGSALSAQSAAESARDATLAAYDSFDDRYLGSKTGDPLLDNDGNALVAGALYYRSTTPIGMKVYTGSVWVDSYADGNTFLAKSNNLSDLPNAATARTNLGLGSSAVTDTSAYATATQGSHADSAYGWGNHALAGYLTTESDPVFTAHVAYGITNTKISNWDAAYGWGNHASAGYLTSLGIGSLTQAYDEGLTALAAIASVSGSDLIIDFGSIV